MALRIPNLNSPTRFPPPTERSDLIALSHSIDLDLMLDAYGHGIFPWPDPHEPTIPWCFPVRRGVLPFEHFRLSSSTRKKFRKTRFRVTFDESFQEIVLGCSRRFVPNESVWITDDLASQYRELHRLGLAHSVEVWIHADDFIPIGEEPFEFTPKTTLAHPKTGEILCGGLLGVDLLGAFSAESMFSLHSNASKFALWALVERLKSRGRTWIDVQVLNPHTQSLGAIEISRKTYLQWLSKVQNAPSLHAF